VPGSLEFYQQMPIIRRRRSGPVVGHKARRSPKLAFAPIWKMLPNIISATLKASDGRDDCRL